MVRLTDRPDMTLDTVDVKQQYNTTYLSLKEATDSNNRYVCLSSHGWEEGTHKVNVYTQGKQLCHFYVCLPSWSELVEERICSSLRVGSGMEGFCC